MARRRTRGGERRRRFLAGLFKLLTLLVIIGVVAFYGYQTGLQVTAEQVAGLRSEVERLSASDRAAHAELADAQAALTAARTDAEQLRSNLNQLAITPELQGVIEVARQRLQAGIDAPRLITALRAADRPRTCREPISKRMTVDGPGHAGPASWLRFGEQVTVTATAPAAPFDPGQPVTVRFAVIGGAASEVAGVLPLHQTVPVKNVEYRFTVTPGAKGTIDIASERCELK